MRDDTSPSDREIAVAYLDAMRLAMAGSDSDETRIVIIEALLLEAPHGPGQGDTLSVRYLMDAFNASDARMTVPA